jgi:hypothetical protein
MGVITCARPNLSDAGNRELEELITEYKVVFGQQVRADRKSVLPYRRWRCRQMPVPTRRLLLAKQVEVGKVLEDMEWYGVTEESNGPSSSPVTLVRKKTKDADLCFSEDYRKLNDVTKIITRY